MSEELPRPAPELELVREVLRAHDEVSPGQRGDGRAAPPHRPSASPEAESEQASSEPGPARERD